MKIWTEEFFFGPSGKELGEKEKAMILLEVLGKMKGRQVEITLYLPSSLQKREIEAELSRVLGDDFVRQDVKSLQFSETGDLVVIKDSC